LKRSSYVVRLTKKEEEYSTVQ